MKKKNYKIFLGCVFLIFLLTSISVFGKSVEPPKEKAKDDTAPYFFVEGDPKVDHFPLLGTKVNVNIAGFIADVELKQTYKNEGSKTIEAVYVFPLTTHSAIYGMQMKIGTRIIDAEIKEKQEAKKVYEDAKKEGKTASLLEQKRPNVFQMNVANILPGEMVEVTVKYTETLIAEEGIYEFVFPTVVGPRYTGESDPKEIIEQDKWLASPYTEEKMLPQYKLAMDIKINSGVPVSDVSVKTHQVDTYASNKNSVGIKLSRYDTYGGNRDFILHYSLKGEAIESGLLLYPGKDEKFFMLTAEPPKRIDTKDINPREYVFIVDVSGSMNGFPLDVSKALIKQILEDLRKDEYFNIVFFAGGSQVLSQEPLKATRGNINKAIDMLEKHRGGGGTNLLAALNTALALPKKEGMSRIVVIATDGYVSIEKKAFDLIRDKLGEANFFAFGIGSSVNRYIIEGIARVGKGSPFIVTNKADAEDAAAKFREYIRCPVLTDIKVKFEGFDGYEVEPVAIPDLFAQRTVVLYGKYKNNKGRIILTGNTASGKYERSFSLSDYSENPENIGLQYLWAREKIANISDYNKESEEVKKEVTALGLKYNLMTAYTSFVAVDKVIKETGEVVTVQQPLPLPEGVSNLAVGDQFYTGTFGGTIQTQPGSVNRNSSEENITVECMKLSKTDIKPLETNVQRTVTEVPVTSGHGYYVRGKQTGLWLDELDGKVHASYLADLLKAMEKDIAADLEDWMKKNHLKMLSLTIEFDNGSIKNIKTDKFEGDKFNQSELEKIFKKMSPSMPVTGEIKMTFLIK